MNALRGLSGPMDKLRTKGTVTVEYILGGRAGEFRADQVLASEFRAATFRPDPHGAMLTKQVRCPPAGAAATDGW